MGSTDPETRFHSLDAVRAWALLAGIVLHATMAHLPGFRDLHWPISDRSTSETLGFTFFVIHVFRMSLFFIIAGFFARLLHQRMGTWGLVKNRLRRIGLPLIAGLVVLAPLIIVAIVIAAKSTGMSPQEPVTAAQPPQVGPPVPLFHLWFLYLLLVFLALLLPSRALIAKLDASGSLRDALGRVLSALFASRLAPLLLALPLIGAFLVSPWWLEWQGIPVPSMGLVPNLPAMVGFGSAFALGWLIHREQSVLRTLAAHWPGYLSVAVVATLTAYFLAGDTLHFRIQRLPGSAHVAYAACYALAAWCWSFACIGAAVRFLDHPSARMRYLADASYWMYLVHLPLVWLLQAWMIHWPLHWTLKFPLVLTITMALLLASYHWLVRGTFLGVFLNGRRYPRAKPLTSSAPSTSPG